MGDRYDRRSVLHLLGLTAASGMVPLSVARAQNLPSLLSDFLSNGKDTADKPDLNEAGPLGDTVMGKPGAPVTIIEYASLACTLCRAFHGKVFPQVKKAYIDTGKVLFIYREFPIGKAAQSAAVVARCAPPKDYFRISEKLLANQGKWWGQQAALDPLYKLVKDYRSQPRRI